MAEEAVVDANALLRHLTNEPPELAEQVNELLSEAERLEVRLVVVPVTVAEVVYVLESYYGELRSSIADKLLDLLSVPELEVLEREVVIQALTWYRDVPQVHFADALISALAVTRGHGRVISLDRALRRLPGVRLVQRAADLQVR